MNKEYEAEIDSLKGELDAATWVLHVIVDRLTTEKFSLKSDIMETINEDPINPHLLDRENYYRMRGFNKFRDRLYKVLDTRP